MNTSSGKLLSRSNAQLGIPENKALKECLATFYYNNQ